MSLTQLVLDMSLAAYLADHPTAQTGMLIRKNIKSMSKQDRSMLRRVLADKNRVRRIKNRLVPEILKINFGESCE